MLWDLVENWAHLRLKHKIFVVVVRCHLFQDLAGNEWKTTLSYFNGYCKELNEHSCIAEQIITQDNPPFRWALWMFYLISFNSQCQHRKSLQMYHLFCQLPETWSGKDERKEITITNNFDFHFKIRMVKKI